MLKSENRERTNLSLTVQAQLQVADATSPTTKPISTAYAFNSAGQLVAHSPINEKGTAELPIPERSDGENLRVLVGPAFNQDQEAPSYDALLRAGATEKRVRVLAEKPARLDFDISEVIWKCWFPRFCTVRGRVVKRVYLGSGKIDLPICNGKVYIYDIDALPILISKLPDTVLERIKYELLIPPKYEVKPFPRPIPLPDPPPFARFSEVAELNPTLTNRMAAAIPQPERLATANGATTALRSTTTTTLAGEFETQLKLASGLQLRNLLVEKAYLLKPYLCYWPWWTYYSKQLLRTVNLQEDGWFETTIRLGCYSFLADQPDLYFNVEQSISGTPVIIYQPPIPCNTYWNYQCGTEVTLVVTDSRAIACNEDSTVVSDGGVTIMSIGQTSLSRILGMGVPASVSSQAGLLEDGSASKVPFGGRLDLRVSWGYGLRYRTVYNQPNFFYRWSYRRLGLGASGWKHLTDAVDWHYRQMVGTLETYPTHNFGPRSVGGQGNLFEVPAPLAPNGTSWEVQNIYSDLASGYFNTEGLNLEPGKYQLRLELFDKNGLKTTPGAASPGATYSTLDPAYVSSTTLEGTLYATPVTPPHLTPDQEDADTLPDRDFIFTVHVDNKPVTATIDLVRLNGGAVADECGFLRYLPTQEVVIRYYPVHENGFATYGLSIVRGSLGIYSVSGEVGSGDFTVMYPPPPAAPTHLPSVEELLAGCNEGEAAYSVNLNVYRKVTNGWTRLGPDAAATQAFALAKKPTP